jgi:hypothetical protein
MVFYEDDLMQVKQSWWGPWRVVNKATGATIAPEVILQERMGFAWKKIRTNKELEPGFRRFCEDVLMQTFGLAAMEPNSMVGFMFAQSEPDDLAASMVQEAIERIKLISGQGEVGPTASFRPENYR